MKSCSAHILAVLALYLPAHAQINDSFEKRILLSGTNVSVSGDNTYATRQPGEPKHPGQVSGHTLWWSWQAPASGWLTFSQEYPTAYISHAVYTGAAVSQLVIAPQLSAATHETSGTYYFKPWIVKAGKTYHIVASAIQDEEGRGVGPFNFRQLLMSAPANDRFPGDQIQTLPVMIRATNRGASPQPGERNVYRDAFGATVWWHWQATAKGRLNIINHRGRTAVFQGNDVGSLTRVSRGANLVSAQVYKGQIYRIAADGSLGETTFDIDFMAAPENDNFARATAMDGSKWSVTGHNHGATTEAWERPIPPETGASVWYSWRAPVSGWAEIEGTSINGRPVFSIYRGSDSAQLTRLTNSVFYREYDPYRKWSKAHFKARAGVQYYIAVDTWPTYDEEPAFADFDLRLDLTTLRIVAPTNHTRVSARSAASMSINDPLDTIDGTISAVEYVAETDYGGQTSLGVVTKPPFHLITSNLWHGRWSITARASNTLGEIRISPPIALDVAPENDHFSHALRVRGFRWGLDQFDWSPFPRGLHASTWLATAELGEPAHGGYAPEATVWYSWRAPAGGTAEVYFRGEGAVLGIYTGSRLASLRPVLFPYGRFQAVLGRTYHFAVSATPRNAKRREAGAYIALNLPVSPPVIRAGSSRLTDGGFQFGVSGVLEQSFVISTSLDLKNWIPLGSCILSNANIVISAPIYSNASRQFFRLEPYRLLPPIISFNEGH